MQSQSAEAEGVVTVVVFEDGAKGQQGRAIVAKGTLTLKALVDDVASQLPPSLKKGQLWLWPSRVLLSSSESKTVDSLLTGKSDNPVVMLIATECNASLSDDPFGELAVAEAVPIPTGPKPLPYVGNLFDVQYGKHSFFAYNIADLFPKYGNFITLQMHPLASAENPGVPPAFIADPEIVKEMVMNEKDFPKMWTSNVNKRLSGIAGNGLFTSSTTDPAWQTARPLMSRPFNEVKLKDYFDIIANKVDRFVAQIARKVEASPSGRATVSDMNEWNCCFTFDTVMHAALGVDLGDMEAMGDGREVDEFLVAFRQAVPLNLKFHSGWQLKHYARPFKNAAEKKVYDTSVATMFRRINDFVEDTRSGKIGEGKSVLHSLLFNDSPTTHDKVKLQTVPGHMVTLMVAGHETTAATIGFCLYYLATNPECLAKAVKEARECIGSKGYLEYKDAGKLRYITACLRETLRLYSAVAMLQRESAKDTVMTGSDGTKYKVPAGTKMYVVCRGLHTNEANWSNPLKWDPERFLDEKEIANRNPHCYYPLGFGIRSCVGQFFAIWEARTCIAMFLNRFNFELPSDYKFEPAQGLGAAPFPKDLTLIFSARDGAIPPPKDMKRGSSSVPAGVNEQPSEKKVAIQKSGEGPVKLDILYGSNVGACEELAYTMADQGNKFGIQAEAKSLDSALDSMPTKGNYYVLVITSTYNGLPPDNANKFSKWLNNLHEEGKQLPCKFKYALCGVGNSQWHATFHKFPKRIEYQFDQLGAEALLSSCLLDVSKEWVDPFESWGTSFWPALFEAMDIHPDQSVIKDVTMSHPKQGLDLSIDMVCETCDAPTIEQVFESNHPKVPSKPLKVLQNRELQYGSSERSTKHIELELPSGMSYNTGGHLAVRPLCPDSYVDKALGLLGMSGDEWICVGTEEKNTVNVLTRNIKMQLRQLLQFLDLSIIPTQKTLAALAEHCPCPPEAMKLKHLASEEGRKEYESYILGPGRTTLEVLSDYRSVGLDVHAFVQNFPLLKMRYYSISSAPSRSEGGSNSCSITVGIVEFETGTGRVHEGLSSGMLTKKCPGDTVYGYVHELGSHFRLPSDSSVPVIMVGPGTGIAPFMGFLQERSGLKQSGAKLGEAVLFFGCRSKSHDFIYQAELDSFQAEGALSSLQVAFSRELGSEKVYVQDLIRKEKELVWRLLSAGAVVYVCGDAAQMAPDVKRAFTSVVCQCSERSEEEAARYIEVLQDSNRYLEDVWG